MNNLTKNLRTHIWYMRDGSELHLTLQQYQTVRLAVDDRKASDFITITCPDTWKVEYDWKIWNFMRFKEKNMWSSEYTVICEYWNRHPLYQWEYNCECFKKYKFWALWLKQYIAKTYNIMYAEDYTEDMKREYYTLLKKEWKI